MAENKERLITTEVRSKETGGLKDVGETTARVPAEVKSWMRKVEEDPGQMKTVSDANGQPLLQTTAPQNPKIKLPVTRRRFVEGFKKKLDEAGRWLSAFVWRLIKVKEGQVEFKEEE